MSTAGWYRLPDRSKAHWLDTEDSTRSLCGVELYGKLQRVAGRTANTCLLCGAALMARQHISEWKYADEGESE